MDDAQVEPHGWLCSETLSTRAGDFEFVNGYPSEDAAARLLELQLLNWAAEVYSTQLMSVSEMALRQGLRAFGATKPTQVVVWEQLMDAKTLLLTANTETVYAISHLALKNDGPTVIETPPHMLGFLQDGLHAIWPTSARWGSTRARAANSWCCRRASTGMYPTDTSRFVRRRTR